MAGLALCASARAQIVTNLNPGQSVDLGNYLDPTGNAILIGDKLFDDFMYVAGGTTTNLLPAGAITLSALSNSVGFGLSFGAPFHTTDNILKDFIIKYSVTVTNSPLLISDIHMTYNGTVVNGGYNSVTETAYDAAGFGVNVLGQVNVFNPPPELQASMVFAQAQEKIFIEKDIQLGGSNLGDSSSISIINQTFSQIPEPSSIMLVFTGLAGLLIWGRRTHL
jgi:hypothetical protein